MAPIKTVLTWTSAFLLSVALGAPIDPSGMNKANGADMASSATPSSHHSEPMHKAPSAPVGSHSPSATIAATPAASSSVAAAASSAAATAVNPTDLASEVLSGLGALGELTALGSRINGKGKRDDDDGTTFDDITGNEDLSVVAKRQSGDLQGLASMAESVLGVVAKRNGGSGGLGEVTSLLSSAGGLTSVLSSISGIAKRDDLEARQNIAGLVGVVPGVVSMVNGLAKRDSDETLEARQLNILGPLATSALSNAGAAASTLGKGAAGSLPVPKSSKRSGDGLPGLEKRQLPSISGPDGLSLIMGALANPEAAVVPVTQSLSLAGSNPLGDMTQGSLPLH